jgi:transcriptional regulator EpsA
LPLLLTLFDAWRDSGSMPFSTAIDGMRCDGCRPQGGNDAPKCLAGMNGAVVHGIRDERGWYDCLYVALGGDAIARHGAVETMGLLLPSIDAAFRKVAHLPMQRGAAAGFNAGTHHARDADGQPGPKGEESGLSGREREIMYWVSVGKTNPEIGQILNISSSTVRNHLQRIFRKLGVINRAQAVFRIEQTANGGRP